MVAGSSIPTAAIRLQREPVQTVTLEAAQRVHAAMFAGPWLHAALVQVLVTGLAGVSWMTSASVWSDALAVLAALLTVRLTASPVHLSPAPATFHAVTIATEAIGQRRLVRPAVIVYMLALTPRKEPAQQNQGDPGKHLLL